MELNSSVSAVITGGASGLGAATAEALAAKGVKVALFDMNEEKGEALAKRITLKLSWGRRSPIKSPIKALDVSRGKPDMEPDTSTTKTYSRGGTRSAVTRSGGCTVSQKKFSSFP